MKEHKHDNQYEVYIAVSKTVVSATKIFQILNKSMKILEMITRFWLALYNQIIQDWFIEHKYVYVLLQFVKMRKIDRFWWAPNHKII